MAPAPAATNAAAVETLMVVTAPPPVPQVSTSRSGRGWDHGAHGAAERAHRAGDLRGDLAPDPQTHEQGRDGRCRHAARHDLVECGLGPATSSSGRPGGEPGERFA